MSNVTQDPSINAEDTPITFELNQVLFRMTAELNSGGPKDIREAISMLDEKINHIQRAMGKLERELRKPGA